MTVKLAAIRLLAATVAVVVSGIGLGVAATPQAAAESVSDPAPAAQTTVVLDRQHADAMSVRLDREALVLKTRADLASGAGQLLDPGDVTFHVSDAQRDRVPALPEYRFLGEPGADIWKISQSYQPGWLWAGWETESIPRGHFVSDEIALQLVDFDGPASVELYMNGAEGPERVLSAGDSTLQTIRTTAGAHTHANWVFGAAGTYDLTFVASATAAAGQVIQSDPQTYHFVVGGAQGSLGGAVDPAEPTRPDPGTPVAPPEPTPEPQVSQPIVPPVSAGPQSATPVPAAPAAGGADCRAVVEKREVSAENVDVVGTGHFDFGPVLEGDALTARVKDDRTSAAQWVDPGLLVFHLGEQAAVNVPSGQFDFLGGGTVWQIPLTQKDGVPWLGWNTQHETIAGHVSGGMTLTLESLDGPGALAVYSLDSWGQVEHKYFGTVDGFPRSTTVDVGGSGVHVHGIWAFTAPGAYHATMHWSGVVDGAQRSGTTVLTFFVGDGDPRSAALTQTVTSTVGRTADGAECQLHLASTGEVTEHLPEVLALVGLLVIAGLSYVLAASLRPRGGPLGAKR